MKAEPKKESAALLAWENLWRIFFFFQWHALLVCDTVALEVCIVVALCQLIAPVQQRLSHHGAHARVIVFL